MSDHRAGNLARLRAEILNAKDLPTIPVLLVHILAAVEGERANTRDLVDLLQRDQALAARVLRLANSSFFGCNRQVGSLPRAVMLLGFSTVKNLALGIKIWEAFHGRGGPYLATLWEHAVLVGGAARLIGQRTRTGDPEELFTAGLLHDIGRLVLALKFPASYASLAATSGAALVEAERAAFEVDHTQAGAWLAEAWALPPAIAATAAQHHEPLAPGASLTASAIVNLANRLAHWTDAQGALAAEAEPELEAIGAAGLSFAVCAEITATLEGQKDELRAFFGGVA